MSEITEEMLVAELARLEKEQRATAVGGFSTQEVASLMRIGMNKARKFIGSQIAAGRMEPRLCIVRAMNGRNASAIRYFVKQAPKHGKRN
jgi:hypothetical protein